MDNSSIEGFNSRKRWFVWDVKYSSSHYDMREGVVICMTCFKIFRCNREIVCCFVVSDLTDNSVPFDEPL